MNLSFNIAKRYIFSKKSTNAINVISGISVFGIAIGTSVMILLFSVFNGLEDLLTGFFNTYNPDAKVVPFSGKTFLQDSIDIAQIESLEGVDFISKTLQDFEEEFVAKMDNVFSIAPSDQLFFKTRNNQSNYIPVSMKVSSVRKLKAKKISFLGAYNWMPNKEAILWFTNEVWPEIAKLNPTTEFHIAGSYSEEIAELKNIEGIELHGFVNSSQEFMKEHGIFIAPILSGSGVKMKVLEAMSHGVPCVLSTHAAEGLNLPEIIPICKNKEAFIEKVSLLLQNEQLCHEIGVAGREYILEKYNSESVSNKIKGLLLNK